VFKDAEIKPFKKVIIITNRSDKSNVLAQRDRTDKKSRENFPPMWGRDWVQSHIEGKISQIFFPHIQGKISLFTKSVWPRPRFDSRA